MSSENNVVIEIGEIENICFVVMPFDSLFQIQYERVIKPAIEELGLKCIRGDEIYSKPQIMADIWKSIRKSRLVIAEMTDRNANVFYEMGLAHAIGKPIILLTRNEEDVPFDLKALRYRYYNTNDPFWGENLRDAIRTMVKGILEQTGLHTYLEGISGNIRLPDPPEKLDIPKEVEPYTQDLTGNWKVSFTDSSGLMHEGVIYITQAANELSATMTITFIKEGVMSVVQEVLIGTINGTQVSLNGVSYTYIHRGASSGYSLDNFELKLTSNGDSMEGEMIGKSHRSAAIFTKE
jgi:nucleoside 2-deoxyribosyltransferase